MPIPELAPAPLLKKPEEGVPVVLPNPGPPMLIGMLIGPIPPEAWRPSGIGGMELGLFAILGSSYDCLLELDGTSLRAILPRDIEPALDQTITISLPSRKCVLLDESIALQPVG